MFETCWMDMVEKSDSGNEISPSRVLLRIIWETETTFLFGQKIACYNLASLVPQ